MGQGYEAWTIGADATLSDRRRWADTPGMYPDGCVLDADDGIWFSDALGQQVVRVIEGGEITETIATPQPTYACTLGGEKGKTLFALCAPGSHPDEVAGKAEGAIYAIEVGSPKAGRP
jgi:sugar lactone lactonase YvrE